MVEVLNAVRALVAAQFGIPLSAIDPDRSLVDLGGDSLSLLALTRKLHDQFGVRIAVRELFEDELPVRELARRLADDPEDTAPGQPPDEGTDFSLYFFGDYPEGDNQARYRDLIAAAEFGDTHGFHALWFPERHFHSFGGLFPNPSVLAAALAVRTTDIRLHAGSVVLPLHHPIRVAEEWSVVDNLSGGRVGLCVAQGWHANDFVLAPEAYGRQHEEMYERLETVRRLWAGERLPARSGAGEPVEVRLSPQPVQARLPLFAAVLSTPASYERAAREGLGVVTNLMRQSVEQLAANITLYRRTRAECGLAPEEGRVVVLVHTYLGDDQDRVRAEAYEPFCGYLRSSLSLFDNTLNSLGIDVDLARTHPDDVDFLLGRAYRRYCENRALIGTPDGVRPVVDALVRAGADEIGCFVDFGLPGDRMLAALPHLAALKDRYAAPPAGAPDPTVPASPAQQRMWLMDRMYPGRAVHHEPKALLIEGPLDVSGLRAALHGVTARHAALRTVFQDGGDSLRQIVRPPFEPECPEVDLTGSTDEQAVRELHRTVGAAVFDLAEGPLWRVRLARLSEDRHLLYLVAHHIVFDSLSTAVFCRDLAAHYRGEPGSLPRIEGPWLPRSRPTAESLEYWKSTLTGAPPLRLPADRPRGAALATGATLVHELDAGLAREIRSLSRSLGGTPFTALLGAVGSVLGRFGATEDIVLGTAVTNRPAGTEDLIGMFVETAAIRLDLSGDPSFAELFRRVRGSVTGALDHQDVPFDLVVETLNPERLPGVNPLFTVLVEYEEQQEVDFGGTALAARLLDVPRDQAPFDLTLYLTTHPGGVRCTAEYDAALFDRDTVARLLEYTEDLLRKAVRLPGTPLSGLSGLIERDAQALADREGPAGADEPACLHELFERAAAGTPDAPALVGDDVSMTYAQLDAAANRLSHRLIRDGVKPGDTVGVCLPRGAGLITALLAVLKCGAAYVPIDPALPARRRRLMTEDSRAVLVLTDTGTDEDLPATPPAIRVDPESLAYCLYTSGSSGTPKAVAVPHRGPVNLVRWQLAAHEPLRTLQWTSPAFDVSVQEIFTTLAGGAALVLLDDAVRHEPAEVAEVVRRHGVERLCMPFTPLAGLLDAAGPMPSLREVFSAGEQVRLVPALVRVLTAQPWTRLYHQYGPTEASVIVTSHLVDLDGGTAPPIGRPIAGVVLRIEDAHGRPTPPGVTGELLIGGAPVAAGYLGDEERTAARFVTAEDGRRFFRTGDLVRQNRDGTLAYVGRIDDQIKIRGHRVEPGETETALSRLPEVAEAVVLTRTEPEPALVAYVVLREQVPDWVSVLRGRLAESLPSHLLPEAWVLLDRLPVGGNGKPDRARLALLEPEPQQVPADRVPATGTEERVHKLWCTELGAEQLPVDASFFEVGGNSLNAVRMLERVRGELGSRVPMAQFLEAPTIRALAARFGDGV
ncbi:MupA/Atu3671 family FMN-dependent luciferase-like monooxygenase [Streptomyces longwoodensis]|uniref:MupA/Atu3671 family FMN-dependent luciferase-like monooxygenase n=1 Tax=Streptomyces longwoodensis TaxID=68231 RepID=UPI0033C32051